MGWWWGVGGRGEGGGGSRVGVGWVVRAWVEGSVSFSISMLRSMLLFQFIKD